MFSKKLAQQSSSLTVPFQLSSSICFPGNRNCFFVALPASRRNPSLHADARIMLPRARCSADLSLRGGLAKLRVPYNRFPVTLSLFFSRSGKFFFYVPLYRHSYYSYAQNSSLRKLPFFLLSKFLVLVEGHGGLGSSIPGPGSVWNQQVSGGATARSKLSPRTKETALEEHSEAASRARGLPVSFLNAKYFSRVKSLEPL